MILSVLHFSSLRQAYQNWVRKNKPEGALPALELTPEQLFYVGFAKVSINLVPRAFPSTKREKPWV